MQDRILFLIGMFCFLLLTYYGVTRKNYYVFAAPLLLVFGLMAVQNFKNIWYLAIFFIPLSINLAEFFDESIAVTFPTDFAAIGLMLFLWVKLIQEKKYIFRFYDHPIFILVLLWLFWLLIATIGSTLPIVSIKNMLSYFWIVAAFYYLSILIFADSKNIVYFFWLIGIAFSLGLMILFAKYAMQGRNPFTLRFNPTPIFNDHTVFGAFTTFFIPMFLLWGLFGEFSRTFKVMSLFIFVMFCAGLFFSYSRGAWVSTLLGLFLMFAFMARKWIVKLTIPITFMAIIFTFFTYNYLNQMSMKNDSVSRESFSEHLSSITNFTTDYSNAERVNRWYCAIQMYKERPLIGLGPGTYAFKYGDYQKTKFRTPVSTNHGDNGTAHNEYLLALSEYGFPGAILMFLLLTMPLYFGIRGFLRNKDRNVRLIYLGVTFGLFTYTLHSMVNNFLDQDKVGVPFFVLLAIITALDRYPAASVK